MYICIVYIYIHILDLILVSIARWQINQHNLHREKINLNFVQAAIPCCFGSHTPAVVMASAYQPPTHSRNVHSKTGHQHACWEHDQNLVGGWTNPIEKYARQNGHLPQIWVKIKKMKAPPRKKHLTFCFPLRHSPSTNHHFAFLPSPKELTKWISHQKKTLRPFTPPGSFEKEIRQVENGCAMFHKKSPKQSKKQIFQIPIQIQDDQKKTTPFLATWVETLWGLSYCK